MASILLKGTSKKKGGTAMNRNKAGFTIVEVMIAVTIFAVGSSIALQATMQTLRHNAEMQKAKVAIEVADQYYELVRNLNMLNIYSNDDFTNNQTGPIQLPNGTFISPGVYQVVLPYTDPETGSNVEYINDGNLRIKMDVYDRDHALDGTGSDDSDQRIDYKDIVFTLHYETRGNKTVELQFPTRVTTNN